MPDNENNVGGIKLTGEDGEWMDPAVAGISPPSVPTMEGDAAGAAIRADLENDDAGAAEESARLCRTLEQDHFDVVMPSVSRGELGEIIRQRDPDLPVVLTSGYGNVLAQDASHGFDLIHKPYSIDQLAATLRKIIRQYGRRTVMRWTAEQS